MSRACTENEVARSRHLNIASGQPGQRSRSTVNNKLNIKRRALFGTTSKASSGFRSQPLTLNALVGIMRMCPVHHVKVSYQVLTFGIIRVASHQISRTIHAMKQPGACAIVGNSSAGISSLVSSSRSGI